MSTLTIENILQLIDQLPPTEQSKLKQLLEQRDAMQSQSNGANGTQPAKQLDKRLPSKPMPQGGMEALRWIAEHRREYAGQWVALEGTRLIAHGSNHDDVWAAAQADSAHLPMVTFVEDPDHIVHIIWA